MAVDNITEQLFQSIDIITNKTISSLPKDKTILCTIEDVTKANSGEYTVSNASVKFTAYSEKTNYKLGQNVWVLVPESDFNQTKLIIGKYMDANSQGYAYVNPMDSFINMTDNVLVPLERQLSEDKYPNDFFGLTANNIKTTAYPYAEIYPINNGDNLLNEDLQDLIAGYDKIGISAAFKTDFNANIRPLQGDYGLLIELTTRKEVSEGLESNSKRTIEPTYQVRLSSDGDMWGNPFNFADYFLQQVVFDLDPEEKGTLIGIRMWFYQLRGSFTNQDGLYPYCDDNGDVYDPNIFMKDINVMLGYSTDKLTTSTAFLFSENSLDYSVTNTNTTDNKKKISTRLAYYINEGFVNVNRLDNLYELGQMLYGIDDIDTLKELIKVYWYRRNLLVEEADIRAGDCWELITDNEDEWNFSREIDNLSDQVDAEKFKVIFAFKNKENEIFNYKASYDLGANFNSWLRDLEKLIKYKNYNSSGFVNEDGTINVDNLNEINEKYNIEITEEEWRELETIIRDELGSEVRIVSNVLEFVNKQATVDMNADLINGVKVVAIDDKRGVYNIYRASQSANSEIINSSDAYKRRALEASFYSKITGEESLDEAERIFWFIPRFNTMVKAPVEGVNYGVEIYSEVTIPSISTEDGKNIFHSAYYLDEHLNYMPVGENDVYDSSKKYYLKSKEILLNSIEDINNLVDYSDKEKEKFLDMIGNYYIILEDRVQENSNTQIKKASLTYQIKSTFRKTFTNNRIYVGIYRYQKIYEGFIDLQFGVHGTNGTDYTLAIDLYKEKYDYNESDGSYKVKNSVNAWTKNDTHQVYARAQLFSPEDTAIPIEQTTYTWTIYMPTKSEEAMFKITKHGHNEAIITGLGYDNRFGGAIFKCVARYQGNNYEGYCILPFRTTRKIDYIDGPDSIIYDSAGTNPLNNKMPYKAFNREEKELELIPNPSSNEGTWPVEIKYLPRVAANKEYFPTIITNKRTLNPPATYLKEVINSNGDLADSLYNYWVRLTIQDGNYWDQPVLTIIDRFGNQLLNSWGGDLVIDKENNSIMSAVMGAGKKEQDNSFTGLLMGDLPKVEDSKKTGIIGYEHGEQSYGLFDDGSMFLGKSSRAQLKLSGSEGYIKNSGYDKGAGIKIDFDGSFTKDNQVTPYIDMKASTGARIYLGTGGNPEKNVYFKLKGNSTDVGDLMHIGNDDYWLQTADYREITGQLKDTLSTSPTGLEVLDGKNGNLTYATKGLKINLKDAKLTANNFELLSVKGNSYTNGFIRLSANANKYPLNINNKFYVDWKGAITATRGRIGDAEIDEDGNLLVTGIWYQGSNGKYTKFMPMDVTMVTSVGLSVGTTVVKNTFDVSWTRSTGHDYITEIGDVTYSNATINGVTIGYVSNIQKHTKAIPTYSTTTKTYTVNTEVVNSISINYGTWSGKVLGGKASNGSASWHHG